MARDFLSVSSHLQEYIYELQDKSKRVSTELAVWKGSRLGPDGIFGMRVVIYLKNT